MNSYTIHIDKEEIFDIPAPVILYYKKGHFVVLEKTNIQKQLIHIVDPSEGRICLSLDDIIDMICLNGQVEFLFYLKMKLI